MSARAARRTAFAASVVAVLLLAWVLVRILDPAPSGGGEPQARGGGSEVEEELSEQTEERLEALEEANEQGVRWQVRTKVAAASAAPAPGWAGERVADPVADDWEPAIAADPTAPFVYLMTTHFGDKPCPGNCPVPHISVHVSSDGGRTWAPQRPLCACKGSWQYDPVVEVVPNTGAVYAAYLNGFNVLFTRSVDHGATWLAPVKTYGNVSWNDKPALATSDDGKDVYISWNGPTGGDPWMAQSHDSGQTWTQTKLVDSNRYFFAFDADVLHDGTVVFAQSDIDYSGPGGAPVGDVRHHVFISRDTGATWEDHVVDTVAVGEPCIAEGCGPDFYIGHDAISADDAGGLVVLYDGAATNLGPQRIFARRSADGGRTWSGRVALSVAAENATSPAVESRGSGDVRAWYMQTSNGDDPDAWNVFYRSSANGGASWSAPVVISDVTSGAAYKHADGFDEVYGDYGEIAITSEGKTIATWGEGLSWSGPGGVWFNRQN
ncbi:MAG TPA: sialidase family protein [Actinomycetota bacterium]|nr:sialidase family protein [Actinomycetota bacterium]